MRKSANVLIGCITGKKPRCGTEELTKVFTVCTGGESASASSGFMGGGGGWNYGVQRLHHERISNARCC
jgi:hypothetical protein